ncbi:MAG: OmpA family protein [Bacteroidetes bacterium]|nr:OmpA family protein [Bacteroidota bacterium]
MSHVVLFKSGKYEISDSEKERLDSLIGVLKRWSNYKLSLYGHTDDVGSDETNEKLSQNRVKAVYDYLVIHQYDTSKMATKSFGEKNPVADNNDSVKKSLNRSVEMVLMIKGIS